MIKLIREGSREHPWILKIIMLLIAATFVIGMGWFGYETSQQPNVVAEVGDYEVDEREFRRVYDNLYALSKEQSDEEVVEADIKQGAMNALLGQKLWLVAADDFGLGVHPDTLRQAIMTREEFQRDGAFDPTLYHRLLAQNRVVPKQFEERIAKSLRIQNVRAIIQDVATINPAEMEEVDSLAARQAAARDDDDTDVETMKARIRLQLLGQKRQRALQAYLTALSIASRIEIRDGFL